MAFVRKKNRVLTVNDNAVETYLNRGYDEINKDGKVIRQATGGKTISLSEYNKVVEENERLRDEIEALKNNDDPSDLTNDEIKAKLDELGIEYGAKDNKAT